MSAPKKKRVCLGAFAGAHGVRGEIKVKSFAARPEDIARYGALESEDGARKFTLKIVRALKGDLLLTRAGEVKTREDAETLKGVRLYIDRAALPEPDEDEFYLEDLIGLSAVDEAGAALGAVNAVYNFGAGDLIELKDIPDVNGLRLVAFTKENAPAIDLAGKTITIRRGALEEQDEAQEADRALIEAAMREEDA